MATNTAAARSPASRLKPLPQKRGAAVAVAVALVGATQVAKPAAHDPRLLPQSGQSPASQRPTMATNTVVARSPASRLASLLQKRGGGRFCRSGFSREPGPDTHPQPEARLLIGKNAQPHGAKMTIISIAYRTTETYIFISICFIPSAEPALRPCRNTYARALNACDAAQRCAAAVPALQG